MELSGDDTQRLTSPHGGYYCAPLLLLAVFRS
jgi:hypothetical protein